MAVGHIAGLPLEETLLSLGGPAAIYLAAVAIGLRASLSDRRQRRQRM